MFMSAYEFLQEILNADLQADFFLKMIYLDFVDSFWGSKLFSGYLFLQDGIQVSEIAWLISANLYTDDFLQKIYFNFEEFLRG